jgi:anti-sigma B factor antagonist
MPFPPDFGLAQEPCDEDGVTLLVASGDIDMTAAREFGRRLDDALRTVRGEVVLDLRRVAHLDSTTLRWLLSARRRAEDRDAALVLVCARPPVLSVLELTGLDELFEVYRDRDSALAAAGGHRPKR